MYGFIEFSFSFQLLLANIALSFIASVSLFTLYMIRNNDYWKKRRIPYVQPIPIFGNIFKVLTWKQQLGHYLWKLYEDHPAERLLGFFCLDKPCLVIRDPELIKRILSKDFRYFSDKVAGDGIHPGSDPISHNFMFFAGMSEWKKKRKEVSSLFSTGRLRSNFDRTNEIADKMMKSLKKETSNGASILDVKEFVDKYFINSTISNFFGSDDDCFENENCPFLSVTNHALTFEEKWAAVQATWLFIAPRFSKLFRFRYFNDTLSSFLRKITKNLVDQREESRENRNDLVDILVTLKNKDNVTDYESKEGTNIVSHLGQIYVGSFETSSLTMSYLLYELAKNPKCQQIAREEASRILASCEELTYERFKEMVYIKNCFLETTRLYPILPFLDRKCVEDYEIPESGLVLEKGISVFLPIWGIHHDPKYFQNPSRFDPNRFSGETNEKLQEFSHLAFGEGPRMCPGKRIAAMSSVIALAKILTAFELKLPSGANQKIRMREEVYLLLPKERIKIEFIELKK